MSYWKLMREPLNRLAATILLGIGCWDALAKDQWAQGCFSLLLAAWMENDANRWKAERTQPPRDGDQERGK